LPVCRVYGTGRHADRLECFSGKRFEELKERIKRYAFWNGDKSGDIPTGLFGTQGKGEGIGKPRYIESFYISFLSSIRKREDIWWDKENWEGVFDRDNPWGDLTWAEEYNLKRILKMGV